MVRATHGKSLAVRMWEARARMFFKSERWRPGARFLALAPAPERWERKGSLLRLLRVLQLLLQLLRAQASQKPPCGGATS